jgi:hypothetical protein
LPFGEAIREEGREGRAGCPAERPDDAGVRQTQTEWFNLTSSRSNSWRAFATVSFQSHDKIARATVQAMRSLAKRRFLFQTQFIVSV